MIITQYIPKHKLSKLDTTHCVERAVPLLLARTGDSSARLRVMALNFIQVGTSISLSCCCLTLPCRVLLYHTASDTCPHTPLVLEGQALRRQKLLLWDRVSFCNAGLSSCGVQAGCFRSAALAFQVLGSQAWYHTQLIGDGKKGCNARQMAQQLKPLLTHSSDP